LSFRTNDDKRIAGKWLKSDGVTPVVITTAALTLQFDPLPDQVDPPVDEHRIDSITPDDPSGWVDADKFVDGVALVTIPHGIWADHVTRTGIWDLVAVGEGLHRCIVRGVFLAQEGVSE
jgi:hypothetical protein